MSKIVRLKESGSFETTNEGYSGLSKLDKKAMIVYCGDFESMDGKVTIKDEDVEKLASNHNTIMAKLSRMASGEHHPRNNPPIQLDHSTSAKDTVGRLVGDLTVGEYEVDGKKMKALFGTPRILGKENVERVEDGRWVHLSMGADLENHRLTELTITPFPAAENASMLAKGDTTAEVHMSYKEAKEKMAGYDKCRKHLTEVEKKSEEDADKHLEGMKDDDVTAMSKSYDEHLSRMAEDEEKKKEEESKRMAANADKKASMIQLAKGFQAGKTKVLVALRKSNIRTRLMKLSSQGKVSPAEIKALNIDELVAKSDEAIDTAMATYNDRQPVIDIGLFGSVKALSASQLSTQASKAKMVSAELEARLNMPSKREEALKELSKLTEGMPKDAKIQEAELTADKGEGETFEKLWGDVKKMMDDGKHDDAKAHLRSHLSGLGPRMGEAVTQADPTVEMSALAEEVKTMHTSFNDLVKLAAPALGVTPEELA